MSFFFKALSSTDTFPLSSFLLELRHNSALLDSQPLWNLGEVTLQWSWMNEKIKDSSVIKTTIDTSVSCLDFDVV